ncbi:hypothetical protein G6F56_014201 [Rhizopus delemar]|nr:hypothetical protein G6F56_014201 [Rhizopus delemar]
MTAASRASAAAASSWIWAPSRKRVAKRYSPSRGAIAANASASSPSSAPNSLICTASPSSRAIAGTTSLRGDSPMV